jgi:uncharacterized protein (TIGR03083 family)
VLDRDEYLNALRRDGAAFAATLTDVPMDAPVPGCPEWTAADLWWHLTEVHDFWCYVVAAAATAPDGYPDPVRPADEQLAATYLAGLEELTDALAATSDDVPVWTWTTDHTVGWVLRRMAHESAAHLGDAQQTAGREPAMDAALASDGVDEFLEWFTGRVADGQPAAIGGSVHLHCTDVPGEWFVVDDGAGGLTVTREHAKGGAAIRGAASDMLFVLWRRLPLDRLEVIGDADLAARFVARPALG